jgi:hypothetical protein
MHDYFTVLASDCVGSDDPQLHAASMRVMTAYRTDVATSAEILGEWAAIPAEDGCAGDCNALRKGEGHERSVLRP